MVQRPSEQFQRQRQQVESRAEVKEGVARGEDNRELAAAERVSKIAGGRSGQPS